VPSWPTKYRDCAAGVTETSPDHLEVPVVGIVYAPRRPRDDQVEFRRRTFDSNGSGFGHVGLWHLKLHRWAIARLAGAGVEFLTVSWLRFITLGMET